MLWTRCVTATGFVPIIERALMDHERSTDYRLTAEDVFDALNGNDET